MKPSRFQRRKLASRAHDAKTILRASIRREDLLHLDEIALAVLECEALDQAAIEHQYRQISKWLHANYTRLDLDDDLHQIRDFAKRLAAELSDGLRQVWFESNSCWDKYWHTGTPHLFKKVAGHQPDGESSLQNPSDQAVAMIDMALVVWECDPVFRPGAQALQRFQDAHVKLPEATRYYIEE